MLTELKNRGLKDVLIACVDGLTGFPEAIEAVFPQTDVQLCIVHMVRHSLKTVSWKLTAPRSCPLPASMQAKDRKALAVDLPTVGALGEADLSIRDSR